eukprot:COSAG04_NODE_2132_length_4728_cov_2.884424_3_plen_861_part_01
MKATLIELTVDKMREGHGAGGGAAAHVRVRRHAAQTDADALAAVGIDAGLDRPVPLSATVDAAKAELQATWGVPSSEQRLVSCGTVLADGERPLGEALVRPDGAPDGSDTLWLICRRQPEKLAALNDEQRRSMFSLGQDPVGDSQLPGHTYAAVFKAFVDSEAWTLAADEAGLQALNQAAAALAPPEAGRPFVSEYPDAGPHISWCPDYGCALIADITQPGVVELRLVCLDVWEFSVHSAVGAGGRRHQSRAGRDAAKLISIGTIEQDSYQKFLALADKFMKAAQKRTGEKRRSAANNPQGNHKTPGLVEAVLKDALAGLDQPQEPKEGTSEPRGGFTDVGLHTGGTARNTTWPLARAVFQIMMEDKDQHELYRRTVAQLQLWLIEHSLSSLSPEELTIGQVNTTMQMLAAVVQEAELLADENPEDVSMDAFGARCAVVRFELQSLVYEKAHAAASKFTLRGDGDFTGRDFNLSLPDVPAPSGTGSGIDALREAAEQNLGWLPSPLNDDASWHDIARQLDQLDQLDREQHAEAALLAFADVERLFFLRAETILADDGDGFEPDEDDVVIIEHLVEKYRTVMNKFKDSPDGRLLLQVELTSRETLVVWMAFCLVHAATKTKYPLLNDFAVALVPDDMRHLVLSERRATDAAICVVNYLRANSAGAPVFSLRGGDKTFDLARQFAAQDASMKAMWKLEKIQAKRREDEHWRQAKEKLDKLSDLDDELEELEEQRRQQNSAKNKHWNVYVINERKQSWEYKDAKEQVEQLGREIQATRKQIKSNEKPPAAVFQPLPNDDHLAFPIIFFLQMPRHFQVLLRMSFTAQQTLVPSDKVVTLPNGTSIKIDQIIQRDPRTLWHEYYSF